MEDKLRNKEFVIGLISTWIIRSTPFKIKKIELEDNPDSIWKEVN